MVRESVEDRGKEVPGFRHGPDWLVHPMSRARRRAPQGETGRERWCGEGFRLSTVLKPAFQDVQNWHGEKTEVRAGCSGTRDSPGSPRTPSFCRPPVRWAIPVNSPDSEKCDAQKHICFWRLFGTGIPESEQKLDRPGEQFQRRQAAVAENCPKWPVKPGQLYNSRPQAHIGT